MTWWWPWRRQVECSGRAIEEAERLRDRAQAQQLKAEQLAPRVDAAVESLRQLRTENHFGPMIENILRGVK